MDILLNNFLLSNNTIITIITSIGVICSLSFLKSEMMKYFISIGLTMFIYTCINTMINNQIIIIGFLTCSFVYVFLNYENITNGEYTIMLLIIFFSILGYILFFNNINYSKYCIHVRLGFDILIDKFISLLNYLKYR